MSLSKQDIYWAPDVSWRTAVNRIFCKPEKLGCGESDTNAANATVWNYFIHLRQICFLSKDSCDTCLLNRINSLQSFVLHQSSCIVKFWLIWNPLCDLFVNQKVISVLDMKLLVQHSQRNFLIWRYSLLCIFCNSSKGCEYQPYFFWSLKHLNIDWVEIIINVFVLKVNDNIL